VDNVLVFEADVLNFEWSSADFVVVVTLNGTSLVEVEGPLAPTITVEEVTVV